MTRSVSVAEPVPVLSILTVSRTPENLTRLLSALSTGVQAKFEVLCSWNGDDADRNRIHVPRSLAFELVEQKPYHFAANNNGLARAARGEYLLFLNDDVIPDTGAIDRALRVLQEYYAGIVGVNLRYPDGRLQHAGVFFDAEGRPFHRLKHQVRWDDPQVIGDLFVPAVTGAFLLIRRMEFARLEFDEGFLVAGEDIALCLRYRENFDREILYVGGATAVHIENATRKKTGDRLTPPEDIERIQRYARRMRDGRPVTQVRRPRIRIVTENPGWILHRKAEEIQKHLGLENVRINEDWPEADIHYYINYGYFQRRPASGLVVANFTHYDPAHLADDFSRVAHEADHCVAVSETTAEKLHELGVPRETISVILVGADVAFQPKLTVGVVGRIYPGGRKGEDIVRALLDDPAVMRDVRIVATQEGWGAPVWSLPEPADFYRAIDYLLIPSRLEGGPVPFMEALACGTLSIAPPIGVVPQFPHVSYPTDDIARLKAVVLNLAEQHRRQKVFLSNCLKGIDWQGWAVKHEKLFRRLMYRRKETRIESDQEKKVVATDIQCALSVIDSSDQGDVLTNHKQKWDQLARENDRYYVRSVNHEQSDEEYEESGRLDADTFVENDPIIRSRLYPFADKTLLEIGCGSGRMTKTFARMFGHVTCIDISRTMLEKAKKFVSSSNTMFMESDGMSVPLQSNSIDLAFSYIVYQHFPSREAVQDSFNGVWKALRLGGLFKVQLRGACHPDPGHWSWGVHYSSTDVEELVRQCQFRMLWSTGAGKRSYWLLLEKVSG